MKKLYYTWTNAEDLHCAFFEEGTQPINSQLVEPPYIEKPILLNGAVVEGITQEEIDESTNKKVIEYRKIIYDLTEGLSDSTLARALGKENDELTRSQLEKLKVFYEGKKNVAERYLLDGGISSQDTFDLIAWEVETDYPSVALDGLVNYLNTNYVAGIPTTGITRLQQYCHVIVVKYGLGVGLLMTLEPLCEVVRSKLLTNLNNLEFDKIEARIGIVKTITNSTSITEILTLKTDFDAV